MNKHLLDSLAQNPVFSNLDPAELEGVLGIGIQKNFAAGEILSYTGDVWPYLLFVETGGISVVKESSEGRELAITQIGRGDLFWGAAFFQDDAPNPAMMKFTSNSSVLLWSRERLLPFLLANGSMTWELSRLMVVRMLNASEIINGLAFQQVVGRLAKFILKLPADDTNGPITRTLTLDDMASRVGSTREMVCRFLQGFADQGLIKITRTELEIVNREELETLARKEKP